MVPLLQQHPFCRSTLMVYSSKNKVMYLRYQDALKDPAKLKEVVAPDFVTHDLPPGMTLA